MPDKHDATNTGFREESDFSESKTPKVKADKLDSSKAKDSVPISGVKNMTIALVRNSAITIVAAVVITFVPLFMWAVPGPGEGITSLFPVAAMVGVPVVLYVMVGFLLKQLPKYNFLSVLGLWIFMMILGTPYVLGSTFFEDAMSGFFNMPAIVMVALLLEVFLEAERLDSQIYLISLIATIVPSILIYLGLRIKIWRQKRGQ